MPTYARHNIQVLDQQGNVVPNAMVEVLEQIEGFPLAQLYRNRNATLPRLNPFPVDGSGFGFFHAKGSAYRIRAYAAGFEKIWEYVPIGRAAETDFQFAIPKGAWNAAVTYVAGEMVYKDGYIFVSREDNNLNKLPDTTTPGDTVEWMFAGTSVPGPEGPPSLVPGPPGFGLHVALSDETTIIVAGAARVRVRAPVAFTIEEVRTSLSFASDGGPVVVDINVNGASILSTKLRIDEGELTSLTSSIPAVISDPVVPDDAEIVFDIDDAGAHALGLKVMLIGGVTP